MAPATYSAIMPSNFFETPVEIAIRDMFKLLETIMEIGTSPSTIASEIWWNRPMSGHNNIASGKEQIWAYDIYNDQ